MSRAEVRELLRKYERAVEDDAHHMLNPTEAERRLVGEVAIAKRQELMEQARAANRTFIEKVIQDLPDILSGPEAVKTPPARTVCKFSYMSSTPMLPDSSYGSLASVFLHLLRDWSPTCEHVVTTNYAPAAAELKAMLPNGGDVLLPGCGLGRLALQLAADGFRVEANDASRVFLTMADYIMNRAPVSGGTIYPLAHVFTENWSHREQYLKTDVPVPVTAPTPIIMVPGDFLKTYGPGCPGQRTFDAIVTCFFIDTAVDIVELFGALDGLLGEGGVWVNVGPLNWKKEARLKLCWEEVVGIWEGMGYEFRTQKSTDVDYHMPRGLKMYTESYHCALTVAVKKPRRGVLATGDLSQVM